MEKKIKFMTPPEIGRLLGCGDDAVRLYIDRGWLKAVNTSMGDRPRWRVHPDDFARFCELRSNRPAVEPTQARRSVPKAGKKYI